MRSWRTRWEEVALSAATILIFGPAVGFLSAQLAVRASAATGPSELGSVIGEARVIDGDALVLKDQVIRLWGIDAPGRDQTCLDARGNRWMCGREAALHLAQLIEFRVVACTNRGRGPDGTLFAVCNADGRNLNARMVARGYAWADPRETAYASAEELARKRRRGVFGAHNTPPWEHRDQQGRS